MLHSNWGAWSGRKRWDLQLTDRSFVCSRVIHLVVPDSLWPVHGLIKHHELHLLLLDHFLLHAAVHILIVLCLIHLTVIEVVAHAHCLVFLLDHTSTRIILKVALLLVRLDCNVGIDTVEVFLLLRKHLFVPYFVQKIITTNSSKSNSRPIVYFF